MMRVKQLLGRLMASSTINKIIFARRRTIVGYITKAQAIAEDYNGFDNSKVLTFGIHGETLTLNLE